MRLGLIVTKWRMSPLAVVGGAEGHEPTLEALRANHVLSYWQGLFGVLQACQVAVHRRGSGFVNWCKHLQAAPIIPYLSVKLRLYFI